MGVAMLPSLEEPRVLRVMARTLLDQAPGTGLPFIVEGAWIADLLWESWGHVLAPRGMERDRFDQIVTEFGNELRLWVVGERPWEQYASGLAGRVLRRLDATSESLPEAATRQPWRAALDRVGVAAHDEMATLVSRIGDLQLLYDIATPDGLTDHAVAPQAAIVWAGARPRDPEVPYGEGRSGSSAAALAEALGQFLLKDPAYPPR